MSKKRSMRKNKNKSFKIIIVVTCIIGVFFIYNKINNNTNEDKKENALTSVFNKDVETYEASILAAGDVMAHSPQLQAQYDSSTKTYNFQNNFKYVKKYVEKADYSLANLETTLAGNEVYPYSSYPMFNSPDELADALKDTGFDLLSTINNHSFDKSDLGVNRTLSTLKEKGFDTVGTRQNTDDNEYIIKDINNIKVGITSYSYGDVKDNNKYLNGIKISEECEDKMNVFDSLNVDKAFETITSTTNKMKDTDMQVVILHWGVEYARNQTDCQKQLAQKLCDAGVDIIIGSHPHVVQPVTSIKSTDGKHETVVAYSLGNFLSNQSRDQFNQYTEDGLMINIDISKGSTDKEAKVEKVTCIPTWLNKYYNSKTAKYVYEIIPLADKSDLNKIDNLSESKIKNSYKNTAAQIETSDLINIVENPFD